jgi:hypothetical protein
MDCTNCTMSNKTIKRFEYSDQCQQKVPELEFSAKTKLSAISLFKAIKSIAEFSESVTISTFNNKQYLTGSNKLNEDVRFILPIVENNNNKIDDSVVKMSCEFLLGVLKEFKVNELKNLEVTLEYSTDYPLKITINELWVVIAPRVIND